MPIKSSVPPHSLGVSLVHKPYDDAAQVVFTATYHHVGDVLPRLAITHPYFDVSYSLMGYIAHALNPEALKQVGGWLCSQGPVECHFDLFCAAIAHAVCGVLAGRQALAEGFAAFGQRNHVPYAAHEDIVGLLPGKALHGAALDDKPYRLFAFLGEDEGEDFAVASTNRHPHLRLASSR